ncbi:MAG: CBASS cGAMP synthase [Gammaproteobacteria bacterium]|nr:CBASS cGAMP synthase [Gammaproteobacteria bacterium]
MKYSAHKLLSQHFLPRLEPEVVEVTQLKEAKALIRNTIREAFSETHRSVTPDEHGRFFIDESRIAPELAESIRKLDSIQKDALRQTKPKFAPQGSFVYKTANSPCHIPPQQIDFDDGVYLPTDLFEDKPIVSKDLFFKIVDGALFKLCASIPGWKFDNSKPTCARVILDEKKHIDVPLYAIPRQKYEEMAIAIKEAYVRDASIERTLLDSKNIFMAMRNKEHWIKSDPKQVSQWFLGNVEDYGEIVRRVSRYLKAWRDFEFVKGGPSSITLMACVVKTFEERAFNGRMFKDDSEALLCCTNKLHDLLADGVDSPIDESEPALFPRNLSDEERQEILSKAKNFGILIKSSLLHANSAQEANQKLLAAFGSRMPYEPQLIVTTAAAMVRQSKPRPQPQPEVKNMSGG